MQESIMKEIRDDYWRNGQYQTTCVEQRNIILIGRTRVGKSTIKSLLVDPTSKPEELTLRSGTRDPSIESFCMRHHHTVLNIIDTPGLFEHCCKDFDPRDNDTIMKTIELCATRGVTKLHAICFCLSISCGINAEDIKSIKLLCEFFGNETSANSYLIITRCERTCDVQRKRICEELRTDIHLKEIVPYFRRGMFFSGSINYDDYLQGNESVLDQYRTIRDYRAKLIEEFSRNIEPFPIQQMLYSSIQRTHQREAEIALEKKALEKLEREQKQLIDELNLELAHAQRSAKDTQDRRSPFKACAQQ